MTDRELLNDRIKNKGIKKGYLAKKMGRSRSTLRLKLSGACDFTESEMHALAEILQLTNEEKVAIFFAG